MTRSIGLFELTWHPQNLRELCRIVDVEADDVTVFTSASIYEDWLADAAIDDADYSWVLRGPNESLESYFRRAEETCAGAIDFLMVLTPFGSGIVTSHFVEFDPDCATVCWLYNARACIESTHAATDARDDLEAVTPRLRRALAAEDPETAERALKPLRYYLRPYVLDNYDGFVVEYPPIREYLAEHWAWSRPVYDFAPFTYRGPGVVRDERGSGSRDDGRDESVADGRDASVADRHDGSRDDRRDGSRDDRRDGFVADGRDGSVADRHDRSGDDPPSESDPVEVTVSGRVVENVRDYDPVLDAFEDLFSAYGGAVALTVLGRPVGGFGDRVMARCRELDARGHRVTYYPDTDWIPTEEFDRALERSDVLLNPIYLTEETTREPAPDEVRGTTKGTGVLFDALGYGTPLVLPDGFTLAPMIEDATVTYDAEAELRGTIATLVEDRAELADLQAAARRNASEYTVERQRRRFAALVDDVLSNQ